jgi:predicted neutral ceramidase superfamily lipid hydrolase
MFINVFFEFWIGSSSNFTEHFFSSRIYEEDKVPVYLILFKDIVIPRVWARVVTGDTL